MKTTITTVATIVCAAVVPLVGRVAAFAPEVSVMIPSRLSSTNFCDTNKILLHAKTDNDDDNDFGSSSEPTSPTSPWAETNDIVMDQKAGEELFELLKKYHAKNGSTTIPGANLRVQNQLRQWVATVDRSRIRGALDKWPKSQTKLPKKYSCKIAQKIAQQSSKPVSWVGGSSDSGRRIVGSAS